MVKYSKHILTITLSLIVLNCSVPAFPQDVSEGRFNLDHSVRITEHGFLAIDEMIKFTNSKSSSVIFQKFELNYDKIPLTAISDITVNGVIDLEVLKVSFNNGTKLIFNPTIDNTIDSGDQIDINIQFYISGQVDVSSTSYYSSMLPLFPSMNRVIDEVNSNIFLPKDSEIINMPERFFLEDETLGKIAGSFQHVMSNGQKTQLIDFTLDPLSSFATLEFPSVKRTIIPMTDGSIIMRDEIRVINTGELQATRLKLNRLDNNGANIDIVPIGNPPLINKISVNLINEVFDIRSIYRTSLSQGEEILFAIEYKLSSSYGEFKDGLISYDLPLTPPIDGVIGNFIIDISPMLGVNILKGESYSILDISSYNEDTYHFNTGIKIAWASGTILPVATILFIISFITLISTKSKFHRIKHEGKEMINLEEMVSLFEEKTNSIEDIFKNYRNKKNISKSSLAETKKYFESLKGKSAGKMGEIRTKINIAKPYLKDNFIELANADKEYNRSVLDMIKLYEQYTTGMISEDTFERLLKRNEKRFRIVKDNLIENMNNIHNEIEK